MGHLLVNLQLLQRFHQHCLCSILKIYWSEFVINIEFLQQAELPSIKAMVPKSRLCWTEHVSRIEDYRLPKIVQYSELTSGKQNRGALIKQSCLLKLLVRLIWKIKGVDEKICCPPCPDLQLQPVHL